MQCVFLRSRVAATLTVAHLVSTALIAQSPPARFPIVSDGKWGLIDAGGEVIVAPQFNVLAACASPGRSMAPRNTPQAVRDGANLIDCGPVRQELITVGVGDKWGAIDPNGRMVIPARFDGIKIWSHFIAARRGDLWGFLKRTADFSVSPQFAAVMPVGDLAAVQLDGKWGLVDTSGTVVLPPQLDAAPLLFLGDDLVLAAREQRWGLLDLAGAWLVEPRFDRIYRFEHGLGNATLAGKMGYIDRTGTWVIEPRFDVAAPFGLEGPALVTLDDKKMFIDREGNVAFEGEFNVVHSFDGRLARAAVGRGNDIKWGYLGTDGAWVLPPVYDDVTEFHEGLAAVTKEGRTSYIDQDGRVVLQLDCEGVSFSEGFAGIIVDGKWGYIDQNGVRAFEPRFDRGYEFVYGLAKVLLGDRIIYVDRDGNEVFAMEFPGLRRNVSIH